MISGKDFANAEKNDYRQMSDMEIIEAAQAGDKLAVEFLMNKYRNLVRMRGKAYFMLGAERDDIIQEGMIGLYKAIRDFRADRLSSFRTFAGICIVRQVISAVKTASRQKNFPLNSALSLDGPSCEEGYSYSMLELCAASEVCSPEELYIERECYRQARRSLREMLSDMEWKVFLSWLDGKTYREMAQELNQGVKSVDNALFRIKRKVAGRFCPQSR